MNKVISFSLWGDNPKYVIGAYKNLKLTPKIYPGWICRFYIHEYNAGLINEFQLCNYKDDFVKTNTKVEIIITNQYANWKGMFLRFYPASEDDIDVFISRDCDSRISEREADAVNEWLNSPFLVHSMADHPYHLHPKYGLMGGMFGMKRHACPDMKGLIDKFINKYPDAWQCDQDFLKDHIYPLVAHKIYAHSDIHNGCKVFPTNREGYDFVGQIFDENDSPVEEHIKALKRVIG